jgi:diguanylate cyclase (GGDEF)-like protein
MRDQARGMGAMERVGRALATDGDARPAICDAALEICGGDVALLFEPMNGEFLSAAISDPLVAPLRFPQRGAGHQVVEERESHFVARVSEQPAISAALVEGTSARSVFFQPVLRDDRLTGLLVVVWQGGRDTLPESIGTLMRVLATHAAAAVEHVALRNRLTRMAITDPLTGLHTWRLFHEELRRELARARRSEHPLSVAIVDVDHLAVFNAHRGDQEGDRLLKESASMWAAQLREVDTIARLDGGEFGILLPDCELGEACLVVDRVRGVTPREQTASAGVARWDGIESVEQVLTRSRTALAAAKVAGRDVTVAAD